MTEDRHPRWYLRRGGSHTESALQANHNAGTYTKLSLYLGAAGLRVVRIPETP